MTEPHCAGAEERNGGKQWSVSEPCRAVLMVKSKIDMYKCIYYKHFYFFLLYVSIYVCGCEHVC